MVLIYFKLILSFVVSFVCDEEDSDPTLTAASWSLHLTSLQLSLPYESLPLTTACLDSLLSHHFRICSSDYYQLLTSYFLYPWTSMGSAARCFARLHAMANFCPNLMPKRNRESAAAQRNVFTDRQRCQRDRCLVHRPGNLQFLL